MPFYPIVNQNFRELSRQYSTITPIPLEARDIQVELIVSLTNRKNVEQYEVELQMQSFVSEAQTSTSTPKKKSLEKEDNMSSESIEEDIDILLKGITELNLGIKIILDITAHVGNIFVYFW